MRIIMERVPPYDRRKTFGASRNVADTFKEYSEETREVFLTVYLDAKNSPIKTELISMGDVGSCGVYPRQILKSALEFNASSIILIHNHPSGDPTPSTSDSDMTRAIYAVAELHQIKLLDHIILGRETHYSYADSGRLGEMATDIERIKKEFRLI